MQNKFNSTIALVKVLLENEQDCRNSDEILYSRVLDVISFEKGRDFNAIPIGEFLKNIRIYDIPKFETVRRARQKLQAWCPYLSADKPVADARTEMEKEFREFAVSTLS